MGWEGERVGEHRVTTSAEGYVAGWEEERVGGHRVATSAEGYVSGWLGGVAEAHVVGE